MDIAYGIKVDSMDNEYVELMESVIKSFGIIKTPGAFWIDSFPLMKYVPAWFPGAGFKRKAEVWRQYAMEMFDRPFDQTTDLMVSSVLSGCYRWR